MIFVGNAFSINNKALLFGNGELEVAAPKTHLLLFDR